jgi:phosphoribosylamine--glycine ligase/phosphoribosylformylglycinamidine cyclo-ligase
MAVRILLLGNGGREHALAWKLSQSKLLDHIFVCPGNGGTSLSSTITNVDVPPDNFPRLVEFAVENEVITIPRYRMEKRRLQGLA